MLKCNGDLISIGVNSFQIILGQFKRISKPALILIKNRLLRHIDIAVSHVIRIISVTLRFCVFMIGITAPGNACFCVFSVFLIHIGLQQPHLFRIIIRQHGRIRSAAVYRIQNVIISQQFFFCVQFTAAAQRKVCLRHIGGLNRHPLYNLLIITCGRKNHAVSAFLQTFKGISSRLVRSDGISRFPTGIISLVQPYFKIYCRITEAGFHGPRNIIRLLQRPYLDVI